MIKAFFKTFEIIGDFLHFIFSVALLSIKNPPRFYLIRNQLFEIGVLSLPVVAITGFSTGMVLAAQSYFQLSDKGLVGVTGLMVAKAMMVELGPVLTAFMVTGRVGAAMCAELGTMKVTEQIDALKSMTVNPLSYLVAPRFIAGTLMMPLLTIFSFLLGIVGGYLIAVSFYNMPHNTFVDPIRIHLNNFDIFSGFIKSFAFGIIIVTISCFRGMTTRGGAAGVGRATTNSVVICYSIILVSNFCITMVLNESHDFFAAFLDRITEQISYFFGYFIR